jgi:hypothetical protein
MDTVGLRDAVKRVINRYAQLTPSHGEIRLDTVFDELHDRYALMQTGWSQSKRVRGNLIYLTIQNNQIYIEYDGIERGIAADLVNEGIPEAQIVHAFLQSEPIAMMV